MRVGSNSTCTVVDDVGSVEAIVNVPVLDVSRMQAANMYKLFSNDLAMTSIGTPAALELTVTLPEKKGQIISIVD